MSKAYTSKLTNRSEFERTELHVITIPADEGGIDIENTLLIDELGNSCPHRLESMSVEGRFYTLYFIATLDPKESRTFTLQEAPNKPPVAMFSGFQFGKALTRQLFGGADIIVDIDGKRCSIINSPTSIGMELTSNEVVRQYKLYGRVGSSPMTYSLLLQVGSGLEYMDFVLDLTASDLSDKENVDWDLGRLNIEFAGMHPEIRNPSRLYSSEYKDNRHIVTVDEAHNWVEGSGCRVRGRVFFEASDTVDAYRQSVVRGFCYDWPESGSYGLFKHLPGPPGWMTPGAIEQVYTDSLKGYQPMSVWGDIVLGMHKENHTAGVLEDMGGVFMSESWMTGYALDVLELFGDQEVCRPTRLKNRDGSDYTDYDRHHIWEGQIFKTSPNHPKPGLEFKPKNHAGYCGRWIEKTGANWFMTYLMLTSDFGMRDTMKHMGDLIEAELQMDTGHPVIDGPGAARAIGHRLQMGLWCNLLSPFHALRTDLAKRIYQAGEVMAKNGYKTLGVFNDKSNSRWFGPVAFSMPWQDAQAAQWLVAAAIQLDTNLAKITAMAACEAVAKYGIGEWGSGQSKVLGVYGAVRMSDGEVMWPDNRGQETPRMFNNWAFVAMRYLSDASPEDADPALIEKAKAFVEQELKTRGSNSREEIAKHSYHKALP